MRIHSILALSGGLLLAAAPARAQQAPARGLQFVGCWIANEGTSLSTRTCIYPGEGPSLHIVNLGTAMSKTESTLRLDGEKSPIDNEGCTGWEQARFTGDGERLIVNAEITCANNPVQKVITAFTITPNGNLVQTSGTGIAIIASAGLRVLAPVKSYLEVPAETRSATLPYLAEAEYERARLLSHRVSARDLLELERMGVATPVIDVLVAASYPEDFVIDASGGVAVQAQGQAPNLDRSSAYPMFMNGYPLLSMYDWQVMQDCARFAALCPMEYRNRFVYGGYLGYNAFGYPYGYPYNNWGWPGYGYPVVVRPVTSLPPSQQPGVGGGRATRGRGYEADGAGTGTAQPRVTTTTTSSTSTGSSTGSSSGGSSSGGTQRTAKPRSP